MKALGGKNSYESIKRYEDKAYDKVLVRMPKGRKGEIQTFAAQTGESVNGFINRAIGEAIGEIPQEPAGATQGSEVILTPGTLKTAQEAAQNAGETVSAFVGRAVETQAQRDNDATECKVLGNDMALDCLAFLSLLKKAAMNNFHGLNHEQVGFVLPYHQKFDIAPCAGLQIESANWATIPKMYNAWWVCELNIVQLVQRPLCVETAKYNV